MLLERFHEGDQVGITNSMYQIAYYISIGASSDEEAARKLKAINDNLHLYDKDGNEMLCKFENYEIFKQVYALINIFKIPEGVFTHLYGLFTAFVINIIYRSVIIWLGDAVICV